MKLEFLKDTQNVLGKIGIDELGELNNSGVGVAEQRHVLAFDVEYALGLVGRLKLDELLIGEQEKR